MAVADIVKVYLDNSGFLTKTVFVTNDPSYNHSLHDEPGLVGIVLSGADYQSTNPPVAINGVAYSASLYAALAAKLTVSNPVLQSKILSNNLDPAAATLAKVGAV